MARRARIVVPGLPHHVTHRGNRKANIFLDDEDRILYLKLFRKYSAYYKVWIWAYTLMINHIHAIVVPSSREALSKTIRETHASYAAAFNRKYALTGSLWEMRFYSCAMEEPHLWAAVRYVERNPVRAGIVSRAEDYLWSSARAHVASIADPLLDQGLPLVGAIANWSDWLAAEDADSQIKAIRQATSTGRPYGSDKFIDRLEMEFGDRVRAQKRGRKVKPKEAAAVQDELFGRQ